MDDSNGHLIAEALGVHYDGIQEGLGMQFTDYLTGSTTYGNSLSEVRESLARMRAKFLHRSDEGGKR